MIQILYGICAENLQSAKLLIETCLQIKMRNHESSYHGGEYCRAIDRNGWRYVLKQNYDSIDEGLSEVDYPNEDFLLYAERDCLAEDPINRDWARILRRSDCLLP